MNFKIFQFSFGDGYAGSAKVAILSSKLLMEKGHNVTLFASKNSLTEKRGQESGVNVIALDSGMEFKKLLTQIIEHYNKAKPDFVISHHSLDRKVGFKLKSKFKNEFINIGYRHNITKSFPVIGPMLYNHYYDFLIACSSGVGDSLIKSGINKIKVIYNGIDVPNNISDVTGEKIRIKYNLHNKIVLGLSTWFHKERKGFDILFNSFKELDDRFVLLLVGIKDDMQNEVYNYASEFGINSEKLIMPGYVDNIWEYYKAMDIFLLPSRSEGFSLALLEAGASGLPIIASEIPGTKEFIINNESGILFNIDKPAELTSAIIKLAKDKKLKKKLSSNAKNDVMNKYLISNYANNLEMFLMQLKMMAGNKTIL